MEDRKKLHFTEGNNQKEKGHNRKEIAFDVNYISITVVQRQRNK